MGTSGLENSEKVLTLSVSVGIPFFIQRKETILNCHSSTER